jgi:hypothetical protein
MIGYGSMKPKASLALLRLRAANQAHINQVFHEDGEAAAAEELRQLAQVEEPRLLERAGAKLVLGQISALVECHGTTYAKPGDIVLLTQDMAGVVYFYSVRAAYNHIAGAGVTPLAGWDEAFALWRYQAGKDPAVWITSEPPEEKELFSARSEAEDDIQGQED